MKELLTSEILLVGFNTHHPVINSVSYFMDHVNSISIYSINHISILLFV
jgi:hypothetical protein